MPCVFVCCLSVLSALQAFGMIAKQQKQYLLALRSVQLADELVAIAIALAEAGRVLGQRGRRNRTCRNRRLLVRLVHAVNAGGGGRRRCGGSRRTAAAVEVGHVGAGRREHWFGGWHGRSLRRMRHGSAHRLLFVSCCDASRLLHVACVFVCVFWGGV